MTNITYLSVCYLFSNKSPCNEKTKKKIPKINANKDRISEPSSRLWFPLFKLDELLMTLRKKKLKATMKWLIHNCSKKAPVLSYPTVIWKYTLTTCGKRDNFKMSFVAHVSSIELSSTNQWIIIFEQINYSLSWSVLTTRTGELSGPSPFTVDANTVIL